MAQSGVGCKFLVKHRQNQVVQALLVHGKLQMVLGADGTLAGRHPEDIPGKAHGRGLGGQIDDVAQVKVGEHIVADGYVSLSWVDRTSGGCGHDILLQLCRIPP